MAKQLLIYEKVAPVSKERHLNWSVKSGNNYSFAKAINSVPLMAVEFPRAASEYTIVFAGENDGPVMPTAIVGVRNEENLYLTETGAWKVSYIPAFIRCYPFVFSSSDGGNTLTLCIDEEFEGGNQEGRGERLFDADGEQTQYLKGVLEFLKQYQAAFQRTQVFCEKLKNLNLLEPMQASLTFQSGEKVSLGGFMAVNREKLKELKGEQLTELVALDELELIYLHLQSLRNFSNMAQHLTEEISGLPEEHNPLPTES
jgi:hypothetical protein